MKTSKSKTINNGQIILALAAILAVSLSCNLPLFSGSGAGDQKLAESIQSSGLVFPDDITLTEGSVIIEYTVYPSDSPELMIEGWLTALLAAYEAEPDVVSYQLITSLNGEPYLEISASTNDLKGISEEELSTEEFLEGLEITDLRPADTRAYGLLSPLALELDRIDLVGSTLSVAYWPAQAEDQAEVMAEWWGIFKALVEVAEDAAVIELRNLYLDGSVITVRLDTDDLLAYTNAEMGDLEYLASLEIETELVELDGVGDE